MTVVEDDHSRAVAGYAVNLGAPSALNTALALRQADWRKADKITNVANALPKSAQPGAKKALQEIYNAEDREHAVKAVGVFAKTYGTKFPKAVKKITDDVDELLTFYDFPAEHWIHLRATNPIESTFATVRLRTKVTKGAGSAAAALAMVFRVRPDPLAGRERTSPRRPRPRRSPLRTRPTRRTPRSPRSLNYPTIQRS